MNSTVNTTQSALLSRRESCRYFGGLSEGMLKKLLRSGALPSVKIGRRRFIRREDADRFIASLAAGSDADE